MVKGLFFVLLFFAQTVSAQLSTADRQFIFPNNLLPNPGFESGRGGWTPSGGTFTTVTSGTNLLEGKVSATWTPTAAQSLISPTITVPEGLVGRTCSGRIRYKGGDSNYSLQVLDSGVNVLASQAMATATTPQMASVTFPCPISGGQFRLSIRANASAALIALDSAYLGELIPDSVAQASFFGGMEQAGAASCTFSENTSSGLTNFVAFGTGTGCNAWTTAGPVTAVGTNDHRASVTNMPAGSYLIVLNGGFRTTVGGTCFFRLSDGTNTYQAQSLVNGAGAGHVPVLTFHVPYTTAGTRTFTIQAADDHAGACGWFNDIASGSNNSWKFYRFPTQSETALRADQAAWRVDANISGASINLAGTSQSAYVAPDNASLTLTNATGFNVLPASIGCAGTTAPSGSTCSGANEQPAISFTVPTAGDVLACASFGHYILNAATVVTSTTFQLVETAINSQTVIQEGKSRVSSQFTSNQSDPIFPHRICGTFNFPTAGQKMIRLMYEQVINNGTPVTNAIMADANAALGGRDVHFEVYPITQAWPMPVIVNSVSTGAQNLRVETVAITTSGSGAGTVCTIDAISTAGWVTATGGVQAGRCTLNWNGIFSARPFCQATATNQSGAANFMKFDTIPSATTATIQAAITGTGAITNASFDLTCIGPR